MELNYILCHILLTFAVVSTLLTILLKPEYDLILSALLFAKVQ